MARRTIRRVVPLMCVLLGTNAAWTSIVTVGVGEVVVVRRLGAFVDRPWGPGLHLGLPWGLERRSRVRLDEVRTIEVGLSGLPGPDDAPDAGEFLVGDESLVRARAVIQYRISDPLEYLRESEVSEELLTKLGESAMARTFASRNAEAVLRSDRLGATREAEAELADDVARLRLGLHILGFNLTEARPPSEVADDFNAAQAAESERDRRKVDAESEAGRVKVQAEAEARALVDSASAESSRTIAIAQGRAGRFLSFLPELQVDRSALIQRLYRDALREILPRVRRKVVTTDGAPVDLGLIKASP